MPGVKLVNDETFEAEVLRSATPVVVDFWGPRCVPCIQLDPFVQGLSDEHGSRLRFVKVIAPENRQLCIRMKVMGLPTFMAFRDGQEIARLTGTVDREMLRDMVVSLSAGQ